MLPNYDVIVVGAGHAGCEAAAAAANMGSKVLLITMDMARMAYMSCNPAMGGIAKGQIVREIDAMGGYSGIVTDASMIQFRMLNKSKGPAMWSPRAQCDRTLFSIKWREILESIPTLDFWQDTVTGILTESNKVIGVRTILDINIYAKSVVLTNGTFLNGLMHVGRKSVVGGRSSELSSFKLSDQLKADGFTVGRMKTGTPARVDGRSIDFSKCIEQKGDEDLRSFSYLPNTLSIDQQLSCWITYTNPKAHDILRESFEDSPLFNGTIQSTGPRYCPSIETKLDTFADKDKHQLFLEPEGWTTCEYYINGFSSSLPAKAQYDALRSIAGLENLKLFRPGYAIEYDYFDPTQLQNTLETKFLNNLYFAGQINGTTGYEEAAGQGLIAGINASLRVSEKEPFVLQRDEAYLGVLIDDLITKGVDEPYRMFTSRAEYRILLRQDNADQRLTKKAYDIGLVDQQRMDYTSLKYKSITSIYNFIQDFSIKKEYANKVLQQINQPEIRQTLKFSNLISRPKVTIAQFPDIADDITQKFISDSLQKNEIFENTEILLKYSGYIDKEKQTANKLNRLSYVKILNKINYSSLESLSTEAKQKLIRINPETIGQAMRIPGISPSDINVLLIYMGR